MLEFRDTDPTTLDRLESPFAGLGRSIRRSGPITIDAEPTACIAPDADGCAVR